MNRRTFISLLGGAAAWPLAARAQQPTKTLKVGTVARTPRSSPQWVAFERRMVELGYQEGRNFSFDFLQAASADEYEALYRKLASREPDVILAIGPEIGLKSALAVTRTVPIVMIAIDYDPLPTSRFGIASCPCLFSANGWMRADSCATGRASRHCSGASPSS
jgi:putative ABC transport system substrate-binding protein